LGGFYSAAFAINKSNIIVGEAMTADGDVHAFGLNFNVGGMTDLGTFGGVFSTASAINDAGQIIGTATTTNDLASHAFFYSGGTLTDIGTLGGSDSSPSALNNLGQVVGDSITSNGVQHAFLWQGGVLTDLNDLLPANSGWELMTAGLINDSGRIVGVGVTNGVAVWYSLALGSGSANNPPVAVAGADQNASCDATITLDGSGSHDPDGDTLTYVWSLGGSAFSSNATVTVSLAVGTYTFTLTVTDPCGSSSSDDVVVTLTDTTPPTGSAPTSITVSADSNCQAAVPNVVTNVTASDNCTASAALVITQSPMAGTVLSKGQHNIVVTVTDASNNSSTANVTLNIVDTTAPTILSSPSSLTVSVGANCQGLVPNVASQVVATDNCGAVVVSQNPLAGTGLSLGQHTVAVTVTDGSGNSAATNVTLNVVDTTAPTILSSPSSLTVSVGANCQAAVPTSRPR
jgi:probable HAF family extracellular repeat protein